MTGTWMLNNMPGLTNVGFAPPWFRTLGREWVWLRRPWVTASAKSLCTYTQRITWKAAIAVEARTWMDYARGARQWTVPWGNHGGNDWINTIPVLQYCREYGTTWEEFLGAFVINQHRNGLMNDWGSTPFTSHIS